MSPDSSRSIRLTSLHILHAALLSALVLLAACSSGAPEGPVLSETTVDGQTVTEINLDAIPDDPVEIGYSEFFDGMNIIRLDSSREALVTNTMAVHFAQDFILLGTQTSSAARLLRFDYEGNFLNEIGGEGGGPGEHKGIYVNNVNYYEEDNTVMVRWDPIRGPQLFRPDGTYLGRVTIPMSQINEIARWSEDEWFTYGSTAGQPRTSRDSLKLAFLSSEGNFTKRIDRTTYPPENSTDYTPAGNASIYIHKGIYKIYYPGDRTLYRIENRELVPEAVIRPGENGVPFNQTTTGEEMTGAFELDFLSETDRNWFIKKVTYVKMNLVESPNQPGRWFNRGFETTEELLVVDKETGRGRTYAFTDDLLQMLPQQITRRLPRWQAGFGAYLAISAGLYLKMQEESDRLDQRSPEVQQQLEVLEGLTPEDNYLIFHFPVPDVIEIE